MADIHDNKMQDMIRTSLENIRAMVDANTVVGSPIETASGTTIIPISKVSVGYASGGVDSDKKENAQKKMFAGGGGTGLSVQPVCFIAVDAAGTAEVLPIGGAGAPDNVERVAELIEKAPDIIEKIKKLFHLKRKKKNEGDAVSEVAKAAAEVIESVADAGTSTVEIEIKKDSDKK